MDLSNGWVPEKAYIDKRQVLQWDGATEHRKDRINLLGKNDLTKHKMR